MPRLFETTCACVLVLASAQASRSQGPIHDTRLQEDPTLKLWTDWWGYNRVVFLPAHTPLPAEERMRVAEGLQKFVLNSNDAEKPLVAEALLGLANFGSSLPMDEREGLLEFLLPFVDAPHQQQRQRALLALGVLGHPKALPTLQAFALDESQSNLGPGDDFWVVPEALRAMALYALGLLGNANQDPGLRLEIVECLWRVLREPRQVVPDIQSAAVLAMGVVPLVSTAGEVLTFEAHPPTQAHPNLDQAPGNRTEQVRFLLELFHDSRAKRFFADARAHALRSIQILLADSPRSIAPVANSLLPYVTKRGRVGLREERQSAALLFGGIGDLDMDPADIAMRAAIQDSVGNADSMVKGYSIIAMGLIGGRRGTGPFPGAAEGEVRDYLVLQATKGKTTIKPWACLALGLMEHGLRRERRPADDATLQALLAGVQDDAREEHLAASAMALALGGIEGGEASIEQQLDRFSGSSLLPLIHMSLALANTTESNRLLEKQGVTRERALGQDRDWNKHLRKLFDTTLPLETRQAALWHLNRLVKDGTAPWSDLYSPSINYFARLRSLTGGGLPGVLDVSWRGGPPPLRHEGKMSSCLGGGRVMGPWK